MYFNQKNYPEVKYPSKTHPNATCATSGCGPVSVAIVLDTFKGFEWFTVPEICEFSIEHGARENEGTNVNTLLKEICKYPNGFSYVTTNNIDILCKHLKNGGMAVINQGDKYNVFSNAGHFVACVGISGDIVEVYDPYMYSGKYNTKTRKIRTVEATRYGCKVRLEQIAKACNDRNPRYYLICYDASKDKTKKKECHFSKKPDFKVEVGKIGILMDNMNVRDDNGNHKLTSQLTKDGQAHAFNQSYAVLRKGTRCTVLGAKENDDYVYMKIPSGWVIAYSKVTGKKYVRFE